MLCTCTYVYVRGINSSVENKKLIIRTLKHVEYLFHRSIIRTGYTTYYMIASYLIISLSLLHIPLVSLSLSLSVCVCLCVNVVVHSLIIIKTKDERRIFSYWPSYVSQCRLTTERRKKKKHTTSTNERTRLDSLLECNTKTNGRLGQRRRRRIYR